MKSTNSDNKLNFLRFILGLDESEYCVFEGSETQVVFVGHDSLDIDHNVVFLISKDKRKLARPEDNYLWCQSVNSAGEFEVVDDSLQKYIEEFY